MPNPHPTPRARRAPDTGAELLPPGFNRRPDGRLRLRYTVDGRRRDVYGWSVDECNRKRYAPPPAPVLHPSTVTTGTYLTRWSAGLTGRANSNATHRSNVERYLVPMLGSIPLGELATPAGRELIRERFAELQARRARPLAPRTVALIHATLRRALNVAVDDGRIGSNPAARLNVNGATGRANRSARVGVELAIPTDEELRRILAQLTGTDRALFELAVCTGLRQSEELGLGLGDVAEGYVHVHRALRRTDRTLDDPKSATSERYVPMPASLAPMLAELRTAQRLAELRIGDRLGGERFNVDELMFTDELGRPLVGSSLSHRLAAACDRAGVRRIRWHDLRHAYASGLINRGVPIAVVSKYLGHADVSITSAIYHHILPNADHTAAQAIAAAEAILG